MIIINICFITLNSFIISQGIKKIEDARDSYDSDKLTYGRILFFWGLINIIGLAIPFFFVLFLINIILSYEFFTFYYIWIFLTVLFIISTFLLFFYLFKKDI